MWIDMWIDLWIDMWIDMWIDLWIDMRTDMWIDMCIDGATDCAKSNLWQVGYDLYHEQEELAIETAKGTLLQIEELSRQVP